MLLGWVAQMQLSSSEFAVCGYVMFVDSQLTEACTVE